MELRKHVLENYMVDGFIFLLYNTFFLYKIKMIVHIIIYINLLH